MMVIDNGRVSAGPLASLAGLAPLLVFSNSLSQGVALGVAFFLAYSAAGAMALLLPARLGRSLVFMFSILGAAVVSSLTASALRLFDPFLFEAAYDRVFLSVFTLPVLRACVIPATVSDRERAIERLLWGIGYSFLIAVTGAAREFLATGAVSTRFGTERGSLLPIFAQPAGAFMLIALAAAAFTVVIKAVRGSES
ncbi:MAG TPA: Rnf-Nqr domain containing protein [Spirochaetales bacterium]|nr:Rnf-Nqr domain containing protein [Spirochaetales bacterium]HPB66210.1 Rnf-Nqr domain containing protein [Spirochaetales bacterium]